MIQPQDFTQDSRFQLIRKLNAQVLKHPFDESVSIDIQHDIAKRILPEANGRMIIPTVYGFSMMIDLDRSHAENMQGSIERNLYILGTYEAGTLEVIRRSLTASDVPGTFVEIGAHNGLMSIYAASVGAAKVFSFEPNPSMFETLQANVTLNNVTNITTLPLAAGDKKGVVSIALNPENSGATHIVASDNATVHDIPVDTVDHVAELERITDVRLILMDVEDYENNVLIGAERIISAYKPDLIIEYNPANPDDRVTDTLKRHGYNVYILEHSRHLPGHLVPFTSTADSSQVNNYFCFQPERAKLLGLE